MKNIYEELEKLQKLDICKVSRLKLYGLYAAVCVELGLAHRSLKCSLKYSEKHQSSERTYGNMFRIQDARDQIWAVMRIYRSLKFALPRSVWFAFKRRYKRDRKKGWKSL